MKISKYLKNSGVYLPTMINAIEKHDDPLQPIFEAITNSLESIKKRQLDIDLKGKLSLELFFDENLDPVNEVYDLIRIEITDNGLGFNDEEFDRFNNLHDDRKGFLNKGTGRVQFLHSFEKTEIYSVYQNSDLTTKYNRRIFVLSKSEEFLKKNAIIGLVKLEKSVAADVETKIIFRNTLHESDKNYFNALKIEELKKEIISHYMEYFCENRDDLPEILVKYTLSGKTYEEQIKSEEIPKPEHEEELNVFYRNKNSDFTITDNKELLRLKTFRIDSKELNENSIRLTSKGEIANKITLRKLGKNDSFSNSHFLFLISGDYIDERDNDTRGKIDIPYKKDCKIDKNLELFPEIIVMDDIETSVNDKILELYCEIKDKYDEKIRRIDELQNMFLLNDKLLSDYKFGIDDSDEKILNKFYIADSKIRAERDAKIKKQLKEIEKLDTTDKKYQEKLLNQVNEFVKNVPMQNRTSLTQYVARRKLVLNMFQKILDNELEIQKTSGKPIDEKLLHNLIFQQSSTSSENSDLWLMNEEYIYFEGVSEKQLGMIIYNGKSLFKEVLKKEEDDYRKKQEGDASQRRPDILLFPDEGKCIIIEFKAPDVNVSEHLYQINRYASLINNLSRDEFTFHTYYGYLIGENIDIDDIEDIDTDFISAEGLDYIYRPYKRIKGRFSKNHGALYTEIIKYSTLLERAKIRNKIFIDKLMENKD